MKCPTCGQNYPVAGHADREAILVGQLKMIACKTTFDSLEEVRAFADKCLKYFDATNKPEVPDSEREAEFWKGHRPKHFTDTLLANS